MALLSEGTLEEEGGKAHPFTDIVDECFWSAAPIASVCVLTYNQDPYICETLDHLLAQTCGFQFEILIGEDCSTDDTLTICLEYQQRYPTIIRVLHSEVNVGLIANFERVIKFARGKYVAGCGGDDYWLSHEKLSKQVRFLQDHADYGMVGCSSSIYALPTEGDVTFQAQMFSMYLPASSLCMRKSLLVKYLDSIAPLFAQEKAEDLPLRLWFSLVSKVYGMSECMVFYRELPDSISHPLDPKRRNAFWLSITRTNLVFLPFLPFLLRCGVCLKNLYVFWSNPELKRDKTVLKSYRRMVQAGFPLLIRIQEPFLRLLLALHPSLAHGYVAVLVRPLRWIYFDQRITEIGASIVLLSWFNR